MRKLLLALAVVFLVPSASFGSFSLFGSYWETEDAGEGLGAGARFGFTLVPQIQIEIGGSLFEEFERQITLPGMVNVMAELEAIPVDAGVRLDVGLPGGFYFGVGVSYFILESSLGSLDDEAGYYVSLGFALGRRLFLEAIYREVEATIGEFSFDGLDPDIVLEDQFDVDLTGIGVNLGFRW